MFSSRLPGTLVTNAVTHAVARRRRAGQSFADLTGSNPTAAGFEYPAAIAEALGDPGLLAYDPQPFGLPSARAVVSADYARRGLLVAPDRIVLTASSSESYSLLFKLLCSPGDNVLVPVPSYPLFEHLAALDVVAVKPYALEYHGRWTLDAGTVERGIDDRTRAVLVVSPNNPTGSRLRRDELHALVSLCASRGLALIGDEVFADYPLADVPDAAESVVEADEALAVALGGLSKSVGLPQLKLGWMALNGPRALVSGALERLEVIADTYLSVSTPVQVAAGRLLELGAGVRRQIADRVLQNDRVLRELAATAPSCRVLPAEGGWSAVVQVPAVLGDEDLVLRLLDRADVLVHPGYFFDFPREGFLVLSLLAAPAAFRTAVTRLFGELGRL